MGGCSVDGPIDSVNSILGFANCVVVSMRASKTAHRKICSLSAHGLSALVETEFINSSFQIHRRTHQSFSAHHGELLYRNDGSIAEVVTSPVDPLMAELEHYHQLSGEEHPALDRPQASHALLMGDLTEQAVEQVNMRINFAYPI